MATSYQHLLHECQYGVINGTPVIADPVIGACGVSRPAFPIPVDEPQCPDCIAIIGTDTPCPACGDTGIWDEA
jgi:hypothetical protein